VCPDAVLCRRRQGARGVVGDCGGGCGLLMRWVRLERSQRCSRGLDAVDPVEGGTMSSRQHPRSRGRKAGQQGGVGGGAAAQESSGAKLGYSSQPK
jgi:hypothetical protein